MSGTFRVPASTSDFSSSPPPTSSATDWVSPPSSPTFARAASHASIDPFAGSAKHLTLPARREFGRSATAPARRNADVGLADLTLVPSNAPAAPGEADVLGQFFESDEDEPLPPSSDDPMSSSVESVPFLPQTRAFSRTESAGTDPLSGLGARPNDPPLSQRVRLSGTSPKKLTRTRTDTTALSAWEQHDTVPPPPRLMRRALSTNLPGQVHWPTLINRIFDEGREAPALLLGGCSLTHIPPLIGDLHSYVAIAPRRADSGKRIDSMHDRARNLVQCYLWDNRLTRLPSALFQLRNLGVLSLRKNALTYLPPAIGELHALRELNVGGNMLTYLPAEIQRLELDTFTYVPNPFLAIPPDARISQRARNSQRTVMGPPRVPRTLQRARTETHSPPRAKEDMAPMVRALAPLKRHGMPTLAEICIRRLLGNEEGAMLLEQYETGCLRSLQYTLDVQMVARLEAARRSALRLWGTPTNLPHRNQRMQRGHDVWYDGAHFHPSGSPESEASIESLPDAMDVDHLLDAGEDACKNVYFNRCPNARESAPSKDGVSDWPVAESAIDDAPLFAQPYEERLEWVSHVAGVRVAKQGTELLAGATDAHTQMQHSGCLPLLWRGCSPGCLSFLEESPSS
ncbi:hypothetical protein CBS9595_003606 [Malassezia furfur]|nr:hypothetical protein CBS9595_003606 [Malassezia furfur]